MARMYHSSLKMGNGNPVPLMGDGRTIDINAIVGNMVDRAKTYYYDRLWLPPGTTVANQYSFFQNPLNSADPYNNNQAKTQVETNITTSCSQGFSAPYDLVLNNLGFYFAPITDWYDLNLILQSSYFEFKILGKVMFSGNLMRHPAGMGVSGFSTKTSESVWGNGMPNPKDVWWLGDFAKYIAPQMQYSLTLYFPETINQIFSVTSNLLPAAYSNESPTGTALPTLKTQARGGQGIWLMAIMNGLTDRPVQ